MMAHLTVAVKSRDDVMSTADRFRAASIHQILALGKGQPHRAFSKPQNSSTDTVELILHLSDHGWNNIRTSSYPDIRKEAAHTDADFD